MLEGLQEGEVMEVTPQQSNATATMDRSRHADPLFMRIAAASGCRLNDPPSCIAHAISSSHLISKITLTRTYRFRRPSAWRPHKRPRCGDTVKAGVGFADALLSKLRTLREDDVCCDVTLVCSDDGTRVRAHRVVLAAQSP